ncbi:4-hydroxythreonine-4-phosphate dehydrogenase PdxA [Adhaeribacter radiodurans]|uniref:4-hydroxythreonine-4-phosphate dehydrogenase PdxA n=1 Tax=Adhaeribacter radiodurans TaxID=2745197 RepID=A0A7L7L518_9BACT|nr:4-hydroxythreonine-4-phosphate dehydrogenase PdxA [Adhaeribacter radiodurans]QMU27897.1 4-hydroxythreonine-4-phosphate dehydrogenase PdxA [Adhaeribacter radiodurans]
MHKPKLKIGITLGDYNGIGPEVIIKTLADARILNFCTPIIYGSGALINKTRKLLQVENFSFQQIRQIGEYDHKRVNVLNCWEEEHELILGTPTPQSGKAALQSIQAASADLKAGFIDGIVTAPIDKDNIQSEEFKFPGHTEFFTSYFEAPESLMFLVSGNLRVATATGHIPVKEVAAKLTTELLLQKLTILLQSLQKDFGIQKPRIAILGLNPHAGENGLLGTEEQDIIIPAIKTLKESGHLLFGPFPADGFFGTRHYQQVDATLAMYHDQGLIPFKTLAFENGVNFTAGLPVVRTSPDHGTAYNIAGANKAQESSFREALFLAIDIIRKRATV